jgi:hypothetical protein
MMSLAREGAALGAFLGTRGRGNASKEVKKRNMEKVAIVCLPWLWVLGAVQMQAQTLERQRQRRTPEKCRSFHPQEAPHLPDGGWWLEC